jgi:hypothetical protein
MGWFREGGLALVATINVTIALIVATIRGAAFGNLRGDRSIGVPGDPNES